MEREQHDDFEFLVRAGVELEGEGDAVLQAWGGGRRRVRAETSFLLSKQGTTDENKD